MTKISKSALTSFGQSSLPAAILFQLVKVLTLYQVRKRRGAAEFVESRYRGKFGEALPATPKDASSTAAWISLNILEMADEPPTEFADKLAMKELVIASIGDQFVVPTLWSGRRLTSEVFNALPDRFVIKASHGNSWHWLVRRKSSVSKTQLDALTRLWLSQNYFHLSKEPQYRDIEPQLIVEPFLTEEDGSDARDYKVHCFAAGTDSEFLFVQVDSDRHGGHRQDFFDASGNRMDVGLGFQESPPTSLQQLPDRENLRLMLELASKLAAPFDYVRVDFYFVGDQPMVGEMTFHPHSGLRKFMPDSFDASLLARLT